MRKLIITALMAAVALPAAASAQSQGELRRDRHDIHQQQRELDQARRTGNRHDIREERRDVREARREYREDLSDRNRRWSRNDWSDWRSRNRAVFARGEWRAPFRYTPFRASLRISPVYYGPRYFLADPWRYHLPPAAYNQRWVRHYNDLLLVDVRRGIVIDVIRNFYR